MRRRRGQRGFMLMEMLGVLILLTAFAIVSAKLFTSLMRQIRDTNAAQDAATQFDAAVAQLRTDVWSADQLQGSGPTLIITSGARTVTWHVAGPGTLTRTDAASAAAVATRTWVTSATKLSIAVESTMVTLDVTPKSGIPDAVCFMAESTVLKGGRP